MSKFHEASSYLTFPQFHFRLKDVVITRWFFIFLNSYIRPGKNKTLWLGYRQLRGSLLRDGPCKKTEERKRKVMKWKENGRGDVKRSFPSSKNSHFQNEAKRKTFLVKKGFICMRIKNYFILLKGDSIGCFRVNTSQIWA